MTKFFITPVLVVSTFYVMLLAFGQGGGAVSANAADQLLSGPTAKVYAIPAASEITWQPSFDVNPQAVHDLSLPTDK